MSQLTLAQDSTDCRQLCTEHAFKEPALDTEENFQNKVVVADTDSRYRLWYLPPLRPPADPSRSFVTFQLDLTQNAWINPLPPLGAERLHTGTCLML